MNACYVPARQHQRKVASVATRLAVGFQHVRREPLRLQAGGRGLARDPGTNDGHVGHFGTSNVTSEVGLMAARRLIVGAAVSWRYQREHPGVVPVASRHGNLALAAFAMANANKSTASQTGSSIPGPLRA
jgi:hypothetical protein